MKTEGAFHTYYMVNAAQHYRPVLDAAQFTPSEVRVLSNFTGGYHDADPSDIKARLFFQLFNPVDWVGCMKTAAESGVTKFIEFGGGIGKGETPAEKKPNLQSIINKNLRALEHEADYSAAINVDTLKALVT